MVILLTSIHEIKAADLTSEHIDMTAPSTLLAASVSKQTETNTPQLTDPSRLRMLIPLYSHPKDEHGQLWRRVVAAAKKTPLTVIFGVIREDATHVGRPDSDYLQGLRLLHDADIKVLAYVETSYGSRTMKDVKEDVKAYSQDFTIDGIFFDEVSGNMDHLAYYEVLISYARSFNAVEEVILNSSYIDKVFIDRSSADSLIVFEGDYPQWLTFDASDYTGIAPQRMNAIVNKVTDVQSMKNVMDSALNRQLGTIYITDQAFDLLPSYFTQEIDYLIQKNREGRLDSEL